MTENDFPPQRRVVWLTPEQRTEVWTIVTSAIAEDPACADKDLLAAVVEELRSVSQRERISGRLVSNHVTGLMLPHDALPVRVTDDEAECILRRDVKDKRLKRMLQPGPRKQGRR